VRRGSSGAAERRGPCSGTHVGRGEVDETGVEDDIIVGVADALAEKLGGAVAVDLVEGDIARLALADVPVREAGHRVRE